MWRYIRYRYQYILLDLFPRKVVVPIMLILGLALTYKQFEMYRSGQSEPPLPGLEY